MQRPRTGRRTPSTSTGTRGPGSARGPASRLGLPDTVVAVEVGNHAYSFGRYFDCDHQTVLVSGDSARSKMTKEQRAAGMGVWHTGQWLDR